MSDRLDFSLADDDDDIVFANLRSVTLGDGLDFLRAADEDEIGKLAEYLTHQDYQFKNNLVDRRRRIGMSQETVAERLGISVESVRDFEHYASDPRMSTVRRYALALNVYYRHMLSGEP